MDSCWCPVLQSPASHHTTNLHWGREANREATEAPAAVGPAKMLPRPASPGRRTQPSGQRSPLTRSYSASESPVADKFRDSLVVLQRGRRIIRRHTRKTEGRSRGTGRCFVVASRILSKEVYQAFLSTGSLEHTFKKRVAGQTSGSRPFVGSTSYSL